MAGVKSAGCVRCPAFRLPGVLARCQQAVDIPEGVFHALRVVYPVVLENLGNDVVLFLFLQDIPRSHVLALCVAL